ncbi:MAG TPA: DUF58 domain-containing protein [Gammaproteobacteria bacterium]
MIPRRPLLLAAGALALAGIFAGLDPRVAAIWPFAALVLLAAASADAAVHARVRAPAVERDLPRSMALGTWIDVKITVRNDTARRPLRLQIFDHYPQTFAARDLPQQTTVAPGRFQDVGYSLRATERGFFTFPGVELRIASPLGLWWRRRFVPNAQSVRVYPNYSTISKLLAYEVDSRLQLAGMRLRQRRGEGTEFHQLRDYREGDSVRAIDWKATARTSRLIAREYQDERDQQVLFMIDAGRRMLAKDAELSHFDHTLNAMLLLSYIALRRGDSVGVMILGADRSWYPPRKGLQAINGLLNHVYDVQPAPHEVDYLAAATELAVKQRRRSLVVLLTNVREEDTDDLVAAIGLLKRRHLVILASLREAALDEALARRVLGFEDALLHASTAQYLEKRRGAHDLLRARGVYVDDCVWSELPAAIANRYLSIKRAGLL